MCNDVYFPFKFAVYGYLLYTKHRINYFPTLFRFIIQSRIHAIRICPRADALSMITSISDILPVEIARIVLPFVGWLVEALASIHRSS
jgi:hypothetical protein